jgi:phosphoribosyl 1,2-cyclic phosphodiesterase
MSLFVTSLNSGSNGNCYYVGTTEEAVLVDGGISRKETEKRMKRLGLSIRKVKAIFVTHEHGDHTHGVSALAKKHNIPVYINERTLYGSRLSILPQLVMPLKAYTPVTIGEMTITGFPKLHDASDPVAFLVESNSVTVGVFTDLGIACDHVIRHFSKCHAAFLEANYDKTMLDNGWYPYHLKERIRGGKGHLSNEQALELFLTHRPPHMSHLFLSHLSQDNNSPRIVRELFNGVCGNTEIVIAGRKKETPIYHIRAYARVAQKQTSLARAEQLALF